MTINPSMPSVALLVSSVRSRFQSCYEVPTFDVFPRRQPLFPSPDTAPPPPALIATKFEPRAYDVSCDVRGDVRDAGRGPTCVPSRAAVQPPPAAVAAASICAKRDSILEELFGALNEDALATSDAMLAEADVARFRATTAGDVQGKAAGGGRADLPPLVRQISDSLWEDLSLSINIVERESARKRSIAAFGPVGDRTSAEMPPSLMAPSSPPLPLGELTSPVTVKTEPMDSQPLCSAGWPGDNRTAATGGLLLPAKIELTPLQCCKLSATGCRPSHLALPHPILPLSAAPYAGPAVPPPPLYPELRPTTPYYVTAAGDVTLSADVTPVSPVARYAFLSSTSTSPASTPTSSPDMSPDTSPDERASPPPYGHRRLPMGAGDVPLTPVTHRPRATHPGCTTIKYNRRSNPELEKRRIHFCEFPGQ